MKVDLSQNNNGWYKPGRGFTLRLLWFMVQAVLIQNLLNLFSPLKIFLLNLAQIKIGSHVYISQGVYCYTRNYNWNDHAFGLMTKPIIIEDGVWIGARSTILPGVSLANHSVITACSAVTADTEPGMIYSGSPAKSIGKRTIT